MATSVLACLFFIFFLPCFSNSCTDKLPCDQSIEIKSPFYLQSDITKDPNCQGNLPIDCGIDGKPFLSWFSKFLPLENISYVNNTITVQDRDLCSSLNKSGCGNLFFNFSTPVNHDFHWMPELLKSLSSVRCDPPNSIQSPPKIFGTDYKLSYSPHDEDDRLPPYCQRPENYLASFEYIFLFENDSSRLSLLSASYSDDLVARSGCFVNSTEVFDPEDGKEHHRYDKTTPEATCDQQCKDKLSQKEKNTADKKFRRRIIIGKYHFSFNFRIN
ncbi:uncharacterized protein LOC144568038 [Carex rostrata]